MSKTVTYYAGICYQLDGNGPRRISVEAPEASQVHLKELVCNNGPFEVLLAEGLIGEELLPLGCPIDMNFFQKRHKFEVGTITPDDPLHLYFEPFSSPSVPPFINCVLTGECEGWTAPKTTESRQRRVGELALHDFAQWLHEQHLSSAHVKEVLKPVEAFLADRDLKFGDLEPTMALEAYLMARGISGKSVRAYATPDAEAYRKARTTPIPLRKAKKR